MVSLQGSKLYETKTKWAAVRAFGPLMLAAVSAQEQSDEMYREFLDILEDMDKNKALPTHSLLYSPVRAPSAKHRAMQKNHPPSQRLMASLKRQVILTDSAFVRGVVTAFTWLIPSPTKVKCMRPDLYKDGFGWLREDLEFQTDEAIAILRELVVMTGYPPLS
jgi:hypothetical protein